MSKWATVAVIVLLMTIGIVAALVAGSRLDTIHELEAKNAMMMKSNKALTVKASEDKADAFRAGIIACTNEDVEFLNDMADEVGGPVGKLFRDWAETWAYDDDTMNMMTEEYMHGQSY